MFANMKLSVFEKFHVGSWYYIHKSNPNKSSSVPVNKSTEIIQ